jgi:hypothetical protein
MSITYFDKKLNNFDKKIEKRLDDRTKAILNLMKQGFEEQFRRLDKLEASLVSLTSSIDRFVEMTALRKQMRDMEQRVEYLELKIKTT